MHNVKRSENEHVIAILKTDSITLSTVSSLFQPKFFTVLDVKEDVLILNGEKKTFLTVQIEGLQKHVKKFCERASERLHSIILEKNVILKTRYPKIIKIGHRAFLPNEQVIIECYLIDERTMVWFPLPDNTDGEEDIKFRYDDTELILPTKHATFESMINGLSSLRFGRDERDRRSRMEFIHQIGMYFAMATKLYPETLIWDELNVPEEITKLMQTIKVSNDNATLDLLSKREREFLRLEAYDPDVYAETLDRKEEKKKSYKDLHTVEDWVKWLHENLGIDKNDVVKVTRQGNLLTIEIYSDINT